MKTRRVTMIDVARLADVSIGTVSRVVNANRAVKARIRERVHRAMKELNFAPDYVAQSMRTQSTKTVGCIVPNIATSLFSQVILASERILYGRGYTLMIANTDGIAEREIQALNLLKYRRVDGILAAFSEETTPQLRSVISALNIPVVLVEKQITDLASSVVVDHFRGTSEAVEYLLMLGHTRILLLLESQSTYFGEQGAKGYAAACASAGVKPDPEMVRFNGLSQSEAYLRTSEVMLSDRKATAIVAGSYAMVGVLRALISLSLRAPDDVSLISLGESDATELYQPSLTSIRFDAQEIGRTATKLLLDQIERRDGGMTQLTIPSELILRRSCSSPRHRARNVSPTNASQGVTARSVRQTRKNPRSGARKGK